MVNLKRIEENILLPLAKHLRPKLIWTQIFFKWWTQSFKWVIPAK